MEKHWESSWKTVSSMGKELKRVVEERWGAFGETMCDCDTMWLWSVIWWIVMWNKCCYIISNYINQWFLFVLLINPHPWHFWYTFSRPMLTRPSEVAGTIPSVPGETTNKWLLHLCHHITPTMDPLLTEAWDDGTTSFNEYFPTVPVDDDVWTQEQILDRHLCMHERPDKPNHQCSYPCPYISNTPSGWT